MESRNLRGNHCTNTCRGVLLDVASEGVFFDKTPLQARDLIENMAANSQQVGTNRSDHAPKKNNEGMDRLQRRGICAAVGHATDMCSTLQEDSVGRIIQILDTEILGRINLELRNNRIIKLTGHSILHNSSVLKFQHQENASAITLRNGKELKVKEMVANASSKKEQNEKLKVVDEEETQGEAPKGKFPPLSENKPVAAFPLTLKKSKKDEGIKELYETFRRCEVELGENVSAVVQRKLPAKFKDPRKYELEVAIIEPIQQDDDGIGFNEEVKEIATLLNSAPELPQSGNLAPVIELKTLPKHLKYVFLGEGETLTVIISSRLKTEQEEQLVKVLREHKTAIGCTIADINGISPFTCMHRILMEEGANPSRQPQRKFNPPMMEVVKAEILKLLEFGVIYPISDNQWVTPILVVPKKTKITVVKNNDDELRIKRRRHSLARLPPSLIGVCPLDSATHRPHFNDDFAKIASPMCKLLQKDVTFEFDEPCKASFEKLKDSLISAPIIQPSDWSKPFEIMCDFSNYVVGEVLGQKYGKASHAIYYASRILNDAQRNYSTTEKELLAVVFALEKFRSYTPSGWVSTFR
ncbi:uncharacterized protein [Henckelia pumila]|uniref:uncharacterized protein n=1 Tax=Henckelia pumila TaxID=405737 RepID=UPI003C6DE125